MKKSFLLCLLMTLFTTWAVQAAELTVHDGSININTAPMYVYYFDDFTRSQTVFPAEELADMKNESILSMKFYTSYTSAYTTASTVDIYLKEVEDATISSFVDKDDATIVYQGTLDFVLEGDKATVTIEFTTPFEYNGGNLMFGCDNTTDAAYQNISFYGENGTGACISGSNSISLANVGATQRNFLPKTTFTYGTPPSCPKVSGLTISNITTTSAALSWDAIGNASAWNFMGSTEEDFPDDASKTFSLPFPIPATMVPDNTVDLADYSAYVTLQPNTTYYMKLQAICGTDGTGDWSNTASFHTACGTLALPFFDGFEDGIDCWKKVDCASGTGINNTEKYEGSYSFKFSYNTTPPQYLISPELVAIDKEVIVEFYFKNSSNSFPETFQVGYSTTSNDVDAFTWGDEVTAADNSIWQNYVETLPAGVKFVAVKYTSNDKYYLYIDNFSVYEVPDCSKPMSLAVSNITAHNATFSWNGESDNGWQLCINDGGDDEYYNVSDNPFSFASAPLKPETEYTAKLRTLCEGGLNSEWSNEVTFTTDVACPAPTFGAEAVSNLGATEATIAWDGNGEDYTLSYRKARYVDGLEETFGTSIPTGWTLYTGLYDEDEGTATLTSSTSCWYFGTSNGVFDNHARVNIYGNYQRWLVTPQFVLGGSSLEFDLALTAYNGTLVDPETTGNDDKFLVLISEDKENWKVLAQWDNKGTEFSYNDIAHTASGQHISLDLSDYEGSNIYIAFYGESTVSNADNNLHIDNVLCGTVHEPTAWISESGITEKSKQITGLEPETKYDVKVQSNCGSDGMSEESEIISFTTTATCVVPANLTASDITAHTATFDWESDGDAWQLSLSCSAGETVFNVDALPYSVETLDAETSYTVKVRTVCGEDYSDWYNAGTLITDIACPAPTNVHAVLTPGDGTIATINAETDANAWVVEYATDAEFSDAQSMNGNGALNAPLTDLTPETTYYARVKAVCGGIDGESAWSSVISFVPTNSYSITINEGTTTNSLVPVYGSWTDAHSNSQFIIPASTLEEIQYAQLTQLTFYANNTNISWGAAQFEVYVLEVNETTISSLYAWDDLEKVMTAANLSIVNGQMVVTFDAPYQYMGGNLLIGIYQPTSGTYTGCSWFGISAIGAALGGYTSNSGSLSISEQNFLPKMTINYIPGEAPSCPKPTGLTIEYNGGTEAVVSWTSDAESWIIEVGDAIIPTTENPYILEDLALATTYQVRVQALCSEENASDWTNYVSFTTDPCLPEDMCEIRYALDDQYDDGWNGASIKVYDKGTNKLLATITEMSGQNTYEGTLAVCDGLELEFVWNNGSFDSECSYTFYDNNDEIIFQGSGALTTVEYIVDCTVPACPKPTNLANVEPDQTSAYIQWESNATAWQWCFEGDEDTPEEIENGEPSFELNDLEPGNDYTIKVRAVCGENEYSDWATLHFSTLCADVVNVDAENPYEESFEKQAACWSLIPSDDDANWIVMAVDLPHEGAYAAQSGYYGTTYLVLPDLAISNEVGEVSLSFWSYNTYPEDYDKNSVVLMTAEGEIELWSPASVETSWVPTEIDLTDYKGQTISIAFKYEGYNAHNWFLDDVKVECTAAEPDPCPAQVLPFHETFEENSETLNCWTSMIDSEEGSAWAWDSDNNHFFRFYASDEPQYLISPELIPEDMNARIAFSYKCVNSNFTESFQLGYSYNGMDPDDFEWTDELLAEDAENWSTFAIVVSGGVQYVAIRYSDDADQYGLQIDEIYVQATDKPTDVEALKNNAQVYKFVKDGNLFILRNGKLFNAQGKFVK